MFAVELPEWQGLLPQGPASANFTLRIVGKFVAWRTRHTASVKVALLNLIRTISSQVRPHRYTCTSSAGTAVLHAGQISDSYGATATSKSDAAGGEVTVRVSPWSASIESSVSGPGSSNIFEGWARVAVERSVKAFVRKRLCLGALFDQNGAVGRSY